VAYSTLASADWAARTSVSTPFGGLPPGSFWGLLLPCTVFVFILFIHINWLGFKLFKHNQ